MIIPILAGLVLGVIASFSSGVIVLGFLLFPVTLLLFGFYGSFAFIIAFMAGALVGAKLFK